MCTRRVSERVRVTLTHVTKTEHDQPTAFLATLPDLSTPVSSRESERERGRREGRKEFGNIATPESITAFR